MGQHPFLLSDGEWLGEGTISFNSSPEKIPFTTRWIADKKKDGQILSTQEVQMQGSDESVNNAYSLSEIKSDQFLIQLENEMVGKVMGSGVIEANKIAWEFRSHINFQGFEIYRLQENGEYYFHAEYASPDLFRTIVEGRIWRRGE